MKINNELKYCQYSRKSSESKDKQALSISDQNSECDKTATQNNLNVVLKLSEAKSAFKPHNRPEFDKMIQAIQQGKLNAILVWAPNRLCRNPQEGGLLLQLLQDGTLKEIRTTSNDTYTSDSDHLVLQIHFGVATQYSRDISRNVKRGLKYKAERGEFPGHAPLGYEGFGNTKSRLIRPDKFEVPLIIKAFEMAKTGRYSLAYIRDMLNTAGLKTKRGKDLSKSHIFRTLTSSIYYGIFQHNGISYQGNYEPLISKSTFDEVQIALGIRSKPKKLIWDSAYNGLFFCPTCGCSITTVNKKKLIKKTGKYKIYSYLVCTHRKGNCHQPPITTKEFDKQIMEKVGAIEITKEKWELALKLFRAKNASQNESQSKFLDNLNLQLKAHQTKLNRLIDMRSSDEITADEFREQKQLVIGEQMRIQEAISRYNQINQNWLELSENFINKAFTAKKILLEGTPEEKKKLIDEVGRNLFLNNKNVELTFKQPYDVLLDSSYNQDMRVLWDSNPRSFA